MVNRYHLLFVLSSTAFYSCTENRPSDIETQPVRKAIGKLVTDSVAPPIVTPVKSARAMPATVHSKPYSFDPGTGKEAITAITPANGLPVGYYDKFVQDQSGNLWFSTYYKLARYDGHNFTSYSLPPGEDVICSQIEICHNELWAVIARKDSTGKRLAGLYAFNGISFEQLPVRLSAFTGTFNGIMLFPQTDGTMWVVSEAPKQLLKFKGRQLMQSFTQQEFSFKNLFDIQTDRLGKTWFTDREDTTLTQYDGHTFKKYTVENGLPKTYLRTAFPFSADSIYLATRNGTFLFNGHQSRKVNDHVNSTFLIDHTGTLWSSSFFLGGTLNKMSPSGTTTIGREDGLETANWDFSLDRDDNVWVLSQNSLKRLYKPVTAYKNVILTPGPYQSVFDSYFDKKGNYWFGSFNNGISCYNGKTLTNYTFSETGFRSIVYTDNNIGLITEDKRGNLWFSTAGNSLVKFDGKSFFSYNQSNGLGEDIDFGLLADSKENMWYPIRSGGVACFNERRKLLYTTAQGLCSNNVECIFEDKNGTMWFGTSDGLSRLENGRFTTFTVTDGLSSNSIGAIAEDEFGNLWLGTDKGLSRFDGNQFTNYTTADGLEANGIRSIEKDSVNDLFWLGSAVCYSTLQIRGNHPDSVVFENFSEGDGFPVKSHSIYFGVDNRGALWSGDANNSIKRLDYRKIKENSKPFILHIPEIRLNNEAVCWSHLKDSGKDSLALAMEMQLRFGKALSRDELRQKASQFEGARYDSLIPFDFIPYNLSLPYHANSISFDFAAIDPHFSKSTRYQYILEGFDKTWSPLSKNTNANFGNLREGQYTFKIKALNPYGIWSEMSYSFQVLPPWYRTWWAYLAYVLMSGGTLYAFIRWRTSALTNEKLHLEHQVAKRTSELKESLDHLKSTQSQLIQSEKMASLGELTAGIAHEIQNPLNFVNNFSEVNSELISEMKEALAKGNVDEARTLATTLEENESKIVSHGKRADAIVKGMLQHSRKSSGQKEPTDINELCDEYLRLAYHGLRAKDKSFNAKFETHLDPALPKVNVVPQEIGRVVLNLINNAFYAVNEKAKQGITGYEPTVSVTTRAGSPLGAGGAGRLEIVVSDNGNGIPDSIKDKIFQPFFTTKPTGQGTGLGLSLSYDIVKAHGGTLRVESVEDKGSTFTIELPLN
jgi:signal transduction histidine kinase/ligand-binding sensor domain-containing protein